jgi:hypothetical protein
MNALDILFWIAVACIVLGAFRGLQLLALIGIAAAFAMYATALAAQSPVAAIVVASAGASYCFALHRMATWGKPRTTR